jgi:antitoxin VapB
VTDRTEEVHRKVEQLARLAHEEHLGGVMVSAHHNFAWLTAGRSHRIDSSHDAGTVHLFVSRAGRRFVLTDTIEAARVTDETLAGLDFELRAYPWMDDLEDPSRIARLAADAAGSPEIGSDVPSDHARSLEPRIADLRATLDPDELPRYRQLGETAAGILADVIRGCRPGAGEDDVAREVTLALLQVGITPVVLLVAGDQRIAKYRHPIPTPAPWSQRLLVGLCGEREGQIVALSRMISVRPDADLLARTHAAARVCAALLDATRPGVTGAALFDVAVSAYAKEGFRGEERLHHQGGTIGYRAREWLAHPSSRAQVRPPQAFAWNPTITGTKIEETVLLYGPEEGSRQPGGSLVVVTDSPGWPSIHIEAQGQRVALPDVLVLGH